MCEIDYGYLQMMRSDVMIADKTKYNNNKACPFWCKKNVNDDVDMLEKAAETALFDYQKRQKKLDIVSKSPTFN